MPTNTGSEFEVVPPGEAGQIAKIVDATHRQLDRRYSKGPAFLRGVHPKDHGCVTGSFTTAPDLPPELRVGLFKYGGVAYRCAIRFSNASPLVTPDSLELGPDGKPVVAHGSRGMAIKIYDVSGQRLLPDDGERTQDFLMINQPVFAFANAEDYEVLSELVAQDERLALKFFERVQSPDPAIKARAMRSGQIVQQVKALACPPSFQPQPASPLDNRYFSAAPFAFGPGKVMKFACTPVNPAPAPAADVFGDRDYLRNAMRARMAQAAGKDICFDFQVQVRDSKTLAGQKLEKEIEDVCTEWKDPWITVARIAIPAQDIASAERQTYCEKLAFTPWHGIEEFRPLGGINRLRKAVYETSQQKRGCPISPGFPGPNIAVDPSRPAAGKKLRHFE